MQWTPHEEILGGPQGRMDHGAPRLLSWKGVLGPRQVQVTVDPAFPGALPFHEPDIRLGARFKDC